MYNEAVNKHCWAASFLIFIKPPNMKNLFLSIATLLSIFAITACINKEQAPKYTWLYGTWQVTELTAYKNGEVQSVMNLEEVSDALIGTLNFAQNGKVTVQIEVLIESTMDDVLTEYPYTIDSNRLNIGDYDLTYEHNGYELIINGQGRFIFEEVLYKGQELPAPEIMEGTATRFVFKKI